MYKWSEWHRMTRDNEGLVDQIPNYPGIYEIRIGRKVERLHGSSRVVNLGVAEDSLKSRVWDQKTRRGARYLPGALKWLVEVGHETFEVRWFPVSTGDEAKKAEDGSLAEFIARHWELPAGNARGPRGRGTDLKVKALLDPNTPG